VDSSLIAHPSPAAGPQDEVGLAARHQSPSDPRYETPRRFVESDAAERQAVQEPGLLHVAAGLGAALVAAGAGATLAGGVGPHHSALVHAVMAHAGRASGHRALVRVGHAGLLHVVGLRSGAGLGLGKGGTAHEAEGGGRNDKLLHLKLLVGCVRQRERRSPVPKPGVPEQRNSRLQLALQLPFFEKGALSDRLVCSAPV
jgi:hypothetical protein